MRTAWLLLALVGCTGIKTDTITDSGEPVTPPTPVPTVPTPTPTDTGGYISTYEPACALVEPVPPTTTEPCPTTTLPTSPLPECVDLLPLQLLVCADTTAPQPSRDTGQSTPMLCAGSGTISEVGATLTPVAGAIALDGFQSCEGLEGAQVRLLDDHGHSWTFGWSLPDRMDVSSLELGEILDFDVRWHPEGQPSDEGDRGAIVLSEGGRLQLVYELGYTLTAAERAGVGIQSAGDACSPYLYSYDMHDVVWVSACGVSALLRTGDSAPLGPIGADDTELTFSLAQSYENVEGDCVISCRSHQWLISP